MKELEVAKWLNQGSKSKVNNIGGRTKTYIGIADEDSSDGKVKVSIDGESVTADGDQGILIPCSPQVKEGDKVIITTINGSPHVSGVDGWGDIVGSQAAFSSAYIGELTAQDITANTISATTGYIDDLTANNITTEKISATTGYIDDLTANNITAEEIITDHASIESLDANYAHISNGVIDNATIGYADVNQLDANFAKINLENVNNSWITNGTIKNAAITDAQIIGVSANKLAAGTIDASKINVTNLNTDNLQVKKINGQPVLGGYLAVDSSAAGYDQSDPSALGWYEIVNGNYVLSSDTTPSSSKAYYIHTASVALYDQTYINSMESDLNDRIDGAIETWTGSAVPTLNNYPASSWTTDDAKSSHVGDIYYVINASQSADGYCYRFAYDSVSDEFVWVLIKDSDVTAALSRLVTAEGKITGLETFETQTSSWIDETDEGLTSIRSRTTALETNMGNKVDVSTFNTLSNTVDGNSSSITTLSHTVDGYTDGQGVVHEGLVNTVNNVSQTATSNSSVISQLTQTLGTNANGTTKAGDVVQRTTAVEQDLAGYKTTVSNTYATNTRVSQAETSITQTANDVTTIINSMVSDSKNLIVYFPDPSTKVDKLYNNKMKTSGGSVRWGQLYAVDNSTSAWANGAPYVRNYQSGASEGSSRYLMFCPFQKNIFRPGDTIKVEGRIYNRDTAVTNSKITVWFYSEFDQAAGTSTGTGSYSTASISLSQNAATNFDSVITIPSDADFSNKYYYIIGFDLMAARRAELLSTSIAVKINNYDSVFTMVRQYGDGVLVCKNPNTVGALVNANGSFDVVSVTWSNGVPTAGTVISKFGGSEIVLGDETGYNAQLASGSLKFRYGTTQLASYTNTTTTLGQTSGSNKNIYFGPNNIYFRSGTTNLAQFSATAIKFMSKSEYTSDHAYIIGDTIKLTGDSGAGDFVITDGGSDGMNMILKGSNSKTLLNIKNDSTDHIYFTLNNTSGTARATWYIDGSNVYRNCGQNTVPTMGQDETCNTERVYANHYYTYVTDDWMVYCGAMSGTGTNVANYRLFYTGSGNLRSDVYENGAWTARYFHIKGTGGLSASDIDSGTLNASRLPASTKSSAASQITAASNVTINSIYTAKFGAVLTVSINFKLSTAMTSGTTYDVGTLISGLRPYGASYNCQTGQSSTDGAWVTTGGIVRYKPGRAVSASTNLQVNATYVCN